MSLPPPRSGISIPDYSQAQTPSSRPSAPSALPSASATEPNAAPSKADDCPPELKKLGECGAPASAQAAGPGAGGPSVLAVLGWVAGGAALLGLPLLPMLWRTRVRGRRLAAGSVLSAWRELGDAAWDVGIAPDESLSPRGAVARIVELGRLEPDATEAVRRVGGAVERALYAPAGADAAYPGLAPDGLLARAGQLAGVSRAARLRARLVPRSAARGGS
ncbi:transglutaminase, partial [Streptomyces goshikiensis]